MNRRDYMRVAISLAILCASAVICSPATALAWGLEGHAIIGAAAMAHLPADVPDFLKAPAAQAEIAYLNAEEDRLKIDEDVDRAWYRQWSTDHYLDVTDDGSVGGSIRLSDLPATRDDFIKTLWTGSHPVDPYDVGFLPYAILEGYQQVRADFGLWRMATTPQERAWRAQLTVHDIGMFAHFVGDGSQPLHVSVHFNGWGDFPNPNGYSQSRTLHADFETGFVDRYADAHAVTALVAPAQTFDAVPLSAIERYLGATNVQLAPLYQLEKRGGFALTDSTSSIHLEAVRFTDARLAAAATMLDSLIETAWRTSAQIHNG